MGVIYNVLDRLHRSKLDIKLVVSNRKKSIWFDSAVK